MLSAHPRCPWLQMGPNPSNGQWPTSPTPESWLASSRPFATHPYPVATPTVTVANDVHPAPSPNQCSASVNASTSFSMNTGTPTTASTTLASGTSTQSKNGAVETPPPLVTTAPKQMPTDAIPSSPCAMILARIAPTVSGVRFGRGCTPSLTTPARRSVTTNERLSAVSLAPRKCCASTTTSRGIPGRPALPLTGAPDSARTPSAMRSALILVTVAGATPRFPANSALVSGPCSKTSRAAA